MPSKNPRFSLPKSPDIPSAIRDQFADLAKTLEPFEQAGIDAMERGPLARQEFSEMMEWNGVLGPRFGARIEKIGRALFADWKRREHEFIWSRDTPKAEAFKRSGERVDRAANAIIDWFQGDRRALAAFYAREAMMFAFVLTLKQNIRRQGLHQFVDEYDEDAARVSALKSQSTLLDWFRVNEFVRRSPVAQPRHDLPPDEIFALVRDMDFAPVGPEGIPLDFSALTHDGVTLRGRLDVLPETDPFILVIFALCNKAGDVMATGAISRLTGEIVPNGMTFVPARVCLDDHELYEAVRACILQGILVAVDAGALVERTYVDLTAEEKARLCRAVTHTADRPLARPVKPTAVATTTPDPSCLSGKETRSEDELSHDPTYHGESRPPLTRAEIAAIVDEMNRPRPDTERRARIIVRREGCLTWPRIMRTLIRIGVETVFTTTHPKLRFNSEKAGYPNSHERNEGKIRDTLYRVLAKLKIDEDTFFASFR